MARVYAQNVIEIAVVADYSGTPHVSVWHMYGEESADTSDESVAQDFANNWQDHIVPMLVNNMTLQRFEWRSLDPDDQNVGTIVPDAAKPFVGPIAGEAAPIHVTYLFHKRTANRTRGKRDGRCYLSGVPEANVDELGMLLPAAVASWNTAWQDFLDGTSDASGAFTTPRYPVVLETPPEARVPGEQAVVVPIRRITAITCDEKVATQRDRLR